MKDKLTNKHNLGVAKRIMGPGHEGQIHFGFYPPLSGELLLPVPAIGEEQTQQPASDFTGGPERIDFGPLKQKINDMLFRRQVSPISTWRSKILE